MNAPVRYLRVDDAARYLGVHRQTLHRWVRDGQIEALKLGRTTRFRIADLDAMLVPMGKQNSAGGLAGGPKSPNRPAPLN